MRIKHVLLGLILAPFGIVLLVVAAFLLWKISLRVFGYRTDITGWQLAEEIALEHLPPTECSKINNWPEFMAPTSGEQRALCYFDLARLTKDPTICEYLLPGNYGERCISEVWKEIIIEDDCASDGKALYCKHGRPYDNRPAEIYWQVEKVPLPDLQACQKVAAPVIRDWCYSERVTRGMSDDCSAVTPHSQRHDDCLQFLARRKRDAALCQPIEDDNLRTVCEVFIRAGM